MQTHVNRHVGGLEVIIKLAPLLPIVNRHVGGLEVKLSRYGCHNHVNRHLGGLEVNGTGIENTEDEKPFIDTQISSETGQKIHNIEIAEKLLAEGVEITFIAKITGLSLAKLQEIQKKR